jgi:nucleotide-binding universal stress UspA family protein
MSTNIKEVLVPVDGSESSIRAARFAMEIAGAMDVGVRLFYVFPAASVELVGMAGMSRADIEHATQSSGQRAFDLVRKALEGGMIDRVEQETALGDPAEEIVTFTERNPAVLVVIGRRGLSRMKSLLLGSVSDKVIRHAQCPVTVIS